MTASTPEATLNMELKALAAGGLNAGPVSPAAMSTQRLRNEDYHDYSSTDVSPRRARRKASTTSPPRAPTSALVKATAQRE